MDDLSKTIMYEGPTTFSAERIQAETSLFVHRAALVYTPTSNIPPEWVGSGPLDVRLPLAAPTYYEFQEISAFRSPRFWLHLIQQATGRLRWVPIVPARMTFICADAEKKSDWSTGLKALLDAFKVKTTGRRDNRLLYYFGAIRDDSAADLIEVEYRQEVVSTVTEAYVRVIVDSEINR